MDNQLKVDLLNSCDALFVIEGFIDSHVCCLSRADYNRAKSHISALYYHLYNDYVDLLIKEEDKNETVNE